MPKMLAPRQKFRLDFIFGPVVDGKLVSSNGEKIDLTAGGIANF